MDVGLLSAFVGGVLALLSPCGALLLPAFFASTVGSGPRLVLHGAVFYVGLLLVLVPLGVGAGALGALFVTHRQTIVVVTAVVLVALGILQLAGLGFDASRLLPGAGAVQARTAAATGLAKTLLLGATSGIAGFCAGPVLGAVLSLAAARGDAVGAGVMLAVYGAGMVLPLLAIAALWRRLGPRGQRILHGRSVRVLGRPIHTTTLVTGLLLIGVGILFWTTNGLVGGPQLVPTDTQAWLQERAGLLTNPAVDIAVIVAVAAIVLVLWARRGRRTTAEADTLRATPQEPGPRGDAR